MTHPALAARLQSIVRALGDPRRTNARRYALKKIAAVLERLQGRPDLEFAERAIRDAEPLLRSEFPSDHSWAAAKIKLLSQLIVVESGA